YMTIEFTGLLHEYMGRSVWNWLKGWTIGWDERSRWNMVIEEMGQQLKDSKYLNREPLLDRYKIVIETTPSTLNKKIKNCMLNKLKDIVVEEFERSYVEEREEVFLNDLKTEKNALWKRFNTINIQ